MTALARGLSVIRSFGKDAVNLTLAEVAERTGLTRPTARRFLLTLESLGYVSTDGKRFWLAPRTLDLGYAYLSSLGIWETAQASMRAVVDTLNESCSMGVLDKGDVMYIARAAPKHMMSLQVNLGSQAAGVLHFDRARTACRTVDTPSSTRSSGTACGTRTRDTR